MDVYRTVNVKVKLKGVWLVVLLQSTHVCTLFWYTGIRYTPLLYGVYSVHTNIRFWQARRRMDGFISNCHNEIIRRLSDRREEKLSSRIGFMRCTVGQTSLVETFQSALSVSAKALRW